VDPVARLIADPLLVIDASGSILEMNLHASALTGVAAPVASGRVFDLDVGYATLLGNASGASGYVIGALDVRLASGETRRVSAHAVALERGRSPRFAVQLLLAKESQFRALTQQVRELNREVGLRRGAQARLEEALALNETLYRELQHRVKNHLQMMLGLFSAAGREAADPSHQALIRRMQSQLSAIVEAQRLMYLAEHQQGVAADLMLRSLADVIPKAAGSKVKVDCVTEPLLVSNDMAFPLALIANELLLNAIKHGATAPAPLVQMRLRTVGSEAQLEVRDNGAGLPAAAPERRSSGLGLVRGLCRQMGARLDLATTQGASVTVTFPANPS
jgi:two-component sensor histidine kinase